MEDRLFIHPFYSDGVKISDWQRRLEAYPYDYCHSVKRAHYRSLGPNNDVYIPKTETQEKMEQTQIEIGKNTSDVQPTKAGRKPMINFASFPNVDTPARFAWSDKPKHSCDTYKNNAKARMYLTTYKRSYIDLRKRPIKEPEIIPDIQEFYPLFNRIPKNDFELVSPLAPNKFMDDHLYSPSEQKKLSNHFRQIRMVSYNPWLGVFR